MFAGQVVTGGEIIVRQRGSRFKAGEGVGMGKDDTLYARAAGKLDFSEGRRGRVVSVLPFEPGGRRRRCRRRVLRRGRVPAAADGVVATGLRAAPARLGRRRGPAAS
jgi:ribosomal protein L27